MSHEDFRGKIGQTIKAAKLSVTDGRNFERQQKQQQIIALREQRIAAMRQKQEFETVMRQKNDRAKLIAEKADIYGFMEEARKGLGLWRKVKKFSPDNGKVGFSLTHGYEYRKLIVGWKPGMPGLGGYNYSGGSISEFRMVRKVIGVAVKSDGLAHIWSREIAKAPHFMGSTDPTKWEDFGELKKAPNNNWMGVIDNAPKTEPDPDTFKIDTHEGLTNFVAALGKISSSLIRK